MSPGEEHIAFFYSYALAVHQWAMAERALFEVLAACVRAEDRDMVGYGFFSIENFRSTLSFVDAILKNKVTSNRDLADWDLLRERLRSAASLRNKIVHGTVIIYPKADAGRQYAIQSWIDKAKGRKLRPGNPPSSALCVRNLVGIRFTFFALCASLQNFSYRLNGQKEQLPKFAEQAGPPTTLADLRRQIHQILGVQPSPSRRKPR